MYNYEIEGKDSQYIDFMLQPGQRIMAEPGALTFMDGRCKMETVMGSGKEAEGFMGKLFGAGQRVLTGENLMLVQIENKSNDDARVVMSAPYQGTILKVDLTEHGGGIMCAKGAYLCGTPGMNIKVASQKKIAS